MPDYRWSPLSEYSQTFWEWETRSRSTAFDDFAVCTMNGEPAWTDGHILCLGLPPGPIRDTPIDYSRHVERLLSEANRKVYELIPLAVIETGSDSIITVLFETGHTIQAKFFNIVREKWPSVRFYGCDNSKQSALTPEAKVYPIIARVRIPDVPEVPEKLVALIMPLKSDHWKERIDEVLALMKGREVHA